MVGALSASLAMFLLGVIGYIASTADEAVAQTQEVVDGIWAIYNLGPIVGAVLALIIFNLFYKLNEEKVAQMVEVNKKNMEIT